MFAFFSAALGNDAHDASDCLLCIGAARGYDAHDAADWFALLPPAATMLMILPVVSFALLPRVALMLHTLSLLWCRPRQYFMTLRFGAARGINARDASDCLRSLVPPAAMLMMLPFVCLNLLRSVPATAAHPPTPTLTP